LNGWQRKTGLFGELALINSGQSSRSAHLRGGYHQAFRKSRWLSRIVAFEILLVFES
jgi:hypothetical protein